MEKTSRSSVPLFFILGRPRSGTTLLRTLLDAHPNVIVPPEFPIIPLLANRFRKVKQWDKDQILSFVDQVYETSRFGHRSIDQLKIDRATLTNNLLSLLPEVTLGKLFTTFNASAGSPFPKEDVKLAGDKNPLYSIYTRFLLKIFPEAKFVCLVRDYRDTFCSLRQMKGTLIEAPNLALQVSRWRYVAKRFLRFTGKYPGRFILVRYEDLVSSPETTFRRISGFLKIPYEPAVFEFHRQKKGITETYSEETMQRFHKNLLSPVSTTRMNLWKSELDPDEVAMADQIAGNYAGRFGYERRSGRFSLLLYLKSRPMAIYCFLLFKFLEAGIMMPYGFRKYLASRLRSLAGFYHRSSRKS